MLLMTYSNDKPASETLRGPFGDARPDKPGSDPRTGGSLPQEDVEDRPNVSTVKPEDYPAADREIAKPK
jgi:hypothetical protein